VVDVWAVFLTSAAVISVMLLVDLIDKGMDTDQYVSAKQAAEMQSSDEIHVVRWCDTLTALVKFESKRLETSGQVGHPG